MRYTGPRCRLCRQAGEKLFLKGARCETSKCPLSKARPAPGQHGGGRRRKLSPYGQQLRAKQKIRHAYQLSEKQFRLGFDRAARMSGSTAENFARALELRLDNAVYRAGLAESRPQARQLVAHGLLYLNGRKATIPSIRLRENDEIALGPRGEKAKLFAELKPETRTAWIALDAKKKSFKIAALPGPDDFDSTFDFASVIEFYSR